MLAKMESTWSLNKIPTNPAGIEATIINFRLVKKYFNCFRKKKRTDTNVAVLRKMSKVNDGSILKKYWAKLRWPEEEIGKNSAMPWIKLRIMACKNDIWVDYKVLTVLIK